jgi:KEOPS complex subunit Cgi121
MKQELEYQFRITAGQMMVSNVNDCVQELNRLSDDLDLSLQVLNADMVCGKKHIDSAILHAIRAWKENTQSTHSLSMEVILYAAGERQVKIALEKMGISSGNNSVVLVLIDAKQKKKKKLDKIVDQIVEKLNIIKDSSVISCSVDKLQLFGIERTEIETVSKDHLSHLVLEKIALVDIIK